ncbi:hypothetical protein TSTA_045750 [Talaromyces stipitatus ATCC 10500]|uniref:Uncharacterized protein n=1 Tax=Talaromyces stipitatus (strain ATCC 10500 / CBS 375.48 / QM 6759 / NRRL 1006) TaxID=441959 RepID=B8MIM6_TALSN|nr:uncharacterized protein TSTA_045750 [Talaromyces stipitatus ATCC 10500]EED15118.1 hypothetical protein TSTA_045750 [Talaromyces stipitatus ATCC 10500]
MRPGAALYEAEQQARAKYGENATILQLAMKSGKLKLARFLLEEGADIHVPAVALSGTPLQEAIDKGELEFARSVLDGAADVNAVPALYNFTAPEAAARTGIHRNRASSTRSACCQCCISIR